MARFELRQIYPQPGQVEHHPEEIRSTRHGDMPTDTYFRLSSMAS